MTPPFDLAAAALRDLVAAGFHPDFPPEALGQLAAIRGASPPTAPNDLRDLLWSSIDNDTSRDLDQIEFAAERPDGIEISVAIADVAATVSRGSPLDLHARAECQTVYTATRNFPMLPTELSTGLTSLNPAQDRAAVVLRFTVTATGEVTGSSLVEATVRNQAQLAYSQVGPWLEGSGPADHQVAASAGLQAQLKLQDQAARLLHAARLKAGALEFHRAEADPIVVDGQVHGLATAADNRAGSLIEELMIAANEMVARTLAAAGRSAIRRVVRSPERWARIVELARTHGTELAPTPDAPALGRFLLAQQGSDPVHYPDLALAVIKLMGPGEYVLAPGDATSQPGHFGLAARDYAHSTAPNRRFADLVTQHIVKAHLNGQPPPYSDAELTAIAARCNDREAAARKVERAQAKRVAAVALTGSVGRTFRGVITGAGPKGTYVRVFTPPVEGKIVRGDHGLDVGDVLNVTLVRTDPEHAFIDFERSDAPPPARPTATPAG